MTRHFKLFPSSILSVLLFAAYFLASLVIFIIPIFFLAKIGLAVLLAGALAYYLSRDAWLLLLSSPVGIRVEEEYVSVLYRGGYEFSGKVSRDSLITPMLTILNVASQEAKIVRSVVIFPDSMDKEDFREMRVFLKWGD